MEAFLFNIVLGAISKIAPISLGFFLLYLGMGLGMKGDKVKFKKVRGWVGVIYFVVMALVVGSVVTNTSNTPKRTEERIEITQPNTKTIKEVIGVPPLIEKAKDTNKDFESKLWQGK